MRQYVMSLDINYILLQRDVNVDDICITGSGLLSKEAQPIFETDTFLEAAKHNRERLPELKWQYVAFEENYLVNYPSTNKLTTCNKETNPIMR